MSDDNKAIDWSKHSDAEAIMAALAMLLDICVAHKQPNIKALVQSLADRAGVTIISRA